MTAASTMDSPYYETDTEKGSVTDSMREAFTKAVQTQKEAETTFGEVSNLLAETKGIGLEHELWKEWDSLRQKRWRKAVQSSQTNAKKIVAFLIGQELLAQQTSLSKSSLQLRQKLIDEFLAEIPDHIQSAVATAAEFQELIDNLEAFPSKVKASLESMKRGFWQKLWDFIRQAASFLWDNKMLILDFGAGLLGFFGLGPASLAVRLFSVVESAIQGGVHSGMDSQDRPKIPSVAEILKEPVHDLKDEVSWEVCVWKSIEHNCLSLQAQYKIAGTLNKRSWGRRLGKMLRKKNKVDKSSEQSVDILLKHRDSIARTLIQCLETYSMGLPPPETSGIGTHESTQRHTDEASSATLVNP